MVALLAIWGAIHGRGPFTASDPAQNALSIQMFLIVVSLPLLYLTAGLQERKRTEEQALENEERLRLALSSAEMSTWELHLATNQITWSEEAKKIFGTRIEGRNLDFESFLNVLHPDDKLIVGKAIARAIGEGSPYEIEFRIVRPNGEIRWVMGKGEVLFDDSGRPIRMLGVNVDITERKQAELVTQAQRQELWHLSRVGILGELSGALAHELNQPLTAILSNAQAAQRFLNKDPTNLTEVHEILRDIIEQDKRAGDVIARLRAMLKKGEIERVPVNLNEITRDVLGLAHSELVRRHVTVTTHLSRYLPNVKGDRVQFQQVLLNLILNAVEAMATDESTDRKLNVTTASNGNLGVELSVADCGTGIPSDRLDRIFEPFYTTKKDGLGLGLAISRSIIVAHGGQLWVTNNPDRGTTFHLSLPSL